MSAASVPFQWVDSCCTSSDPDLFSPLSSGAAHLGKGEGDEKAGPVGTLRQGSLPGLFLLFPRFYEPHGQIIHLVGTFSLQNSLRSSFCSDHQKVTPHPTHCWNFPPKETTPQDGSYTMEHIRILAGTFKKILILTASVPSSDAHPVGLVMKVLNLNFVIALQIIGTQTQLRSFSLEPIYQFSRAAKHHRLGDLNSRHLFLQFWRLEV